MLKPETASHLGYAAPALSPRFKRRSTALTAIAASLMLSGAAWAQALPGTDASAQQDMLRAAGVSNPTTGSGMAGQSRNIGTPQAGSQPVLPELTPEFKRPAELPKPNQFQRFVQESTGKLLPVYGAELFAQTQTYAPVSNIAPPANYVLGPGDEVQLQVWGAIDLAAKLVVDSKGQITIPKVGAVTVAGISVGKLEPTLKADRKSVV